MRVVREGILLTEEHTVTIRRLLFAAAQGSPPDPGTAERLFLEILARRRGAGDMDGKEGEEE